MRMSIRVCSVLVLCATLTIWGQIVEPNVTFERILQADREPHNWLTYSGNVLGRRHSQLTEITPSNVRNLQLAWIWQGRQFAWTRMGADPGSMEPKFEATPLVVDGQLYTVQAPNDVIALDATTGRMRWTPAIAQRSGRCPCPCACPAGPRSEN